MVKYVSAEVRLNDERISRWYIVFDKTIRRVEEIRRVGRVQHRRGERRIRGGYMFRRRCL
jgi:hypothetical protein